jgi:hypothetical protein
MYGKQQSFWVTTKGLAALGLIGAVTYFLLTEHRQHVFEFLPYLIFLACPLMHLFMHKGHGHGGLPLAGWCLATSTLPETYRVLLSSTPWCTWN